MKFRHLRSRYIISSEINVRGHYRRRGRHRGRCHDHGRFVEQHREDYTDTEELHCIPLASELVHLPTCQLLPLSYHFWGPKAKCRCFSVRPLPQRLIGELNSVLLGCLCRSMRWLDIDSLLMGRNNQVLPRQHTVSRERCPAPLQ
jgi:hypothetical protein